MSEPTVLPFDGDTARDVFRAVLDAFANPGRIRHLSCPTGSHGPAVAWPVLALADLEVTLAVVGEPTESADLGARLSRATGARLTPAIGDADMVLLANGLTVDALTSCRVGTADAPEHGARVIAACSTIGSLPAHGSRASVWVAGPGAAHGRRIDLGGVEPAAIEELGRINAAYPAGVDLVFVAPDGSIVGVPRSCRVDVVAEVG